MSRLIDEGVDDAVRRGMEVLHVQAKGLSALSLAYLFKELSQADSVAAFAAHWSDWVHRHEPGGEAGEPLLLAIDDVTWPDDGEVIGPCAGALTLSGRPVVWLVGGEVPPAAAGPGMSATPEQAQEALDDGNTVQCRLLPLTEPAVAAIAADILGMPAGPDILQLCRHAGGAPGLIVKILDGIQVTADARGNAVLLTGNAFPAAVRSIAGDRLRPLTPGCRHVLDVAAVLGPSCDIGELAAVLQQPTIGLLPALREAAGAGVLHANGSRLSFQDVLVWQAVAGEIPQSVRAALLRDVADALLDNGGAPIDALRYLLRAARAGDVRAAVRLAAAATAALTGDPAEALDLANDALELHTGTQCDRIALESALATALIGTGRPADAVVALRRAMAQPLSNAQAAELRCRLAQMLMLTGDDIGAHALAREVGESPKLPMRMRDHAAVLRAVTGVADDERHGPVCRTAAAGCGPFHAEALAVLATRAWNAGQTSEAVRLLSDAGHGVPPAPTMTHFMLVAKLIQLRRTAEAEALITSVTTASDLGGWGAVRRTVRAWARLENGETDAAEHEALAALAAGNDHGVRVMQPVAEAVLAIAALRRGDIPAAAQYAAPATERLLGGTLNLHAGAAPAWAALMKAEATDGAQGAIGLVDALLGSGQRLEGLLLHAPYAPAWLTRVAVTAGCGSLADRVCATADQLAKLNPDVPAVAVGAEHATALRLGDVEVLTRLAGEHSDLWSQAQAAEDSACLLTEQPGDNPDDRSTAVPLLETAAERYAAAGATRDAARVRSRLRLLGVRRRHWTHSDRPATGWDSLTTTERTVAELVAQGLTNRQAAAQMFLSHYTVNFHLRSVFRKLTINSRVELAHRLGTLRPSTPLTES